MAELDSTPAGFFVLLSDFCFLVTARGAYHPGMVAALVEKTLPYPRAKKRGIMRREGPTRHGHFRVTPMACSLIERILI